MTVTPSEASALESTAEIAADVDQAFAADTELDLGIPEEVPAPMTPAAVQ